MASRWLVAEIPLVSRGLNGSKNYNEVPFDALIDADNLTFEDGNISKEGGASKFNTDVIPGTPSVLGGWDWNHDGNSQRSIVVTDAGTILRATGIRYSGTMKSGLSVSANTAPHFSEGGQESSANNRKLFICTGTNQVQVVSGDGATTSDLATPPADWATKYPLFMLNHEGRMWGGGNTNDPHRLYYSTQADHEDWTTTATPSIDAGTVAIYPGEGQTLVNAISFKGYIVCFKYPRGVYVVDTTDPAVENWKVYRISEKLGAAWVQCVTMIENDIVFIDPTLNIRTLSSVDEFGNVGTYSLSDVANMDDWFRENIDFSGYKQWRMAYYTTKREIHIGLTGTGASNNNYRLVIDYVNPQQPRFRYSTRDTPVSLWLRESTSKGNNIPDLLMGEDVGFVYILDDTSYSKDGAAYNTVFQTPHLNMAHLDPAFATRRKNGHFLEILAKPTATYTLDFDVFWDNVNTQTVSFSLTSPVGAILGSMVLGTGVLGSSTVIVRKKRITGGGRLLSIKGQQNAAGENFALARMYLHFHVGDERI